ncbi:L-aspartate oxidase [Klebsiella indica]|uniref:L-aspartate oxidase n=1 Tax=Klebsiella indica TaxID=2582917 RepID=A0A5R9LIA2_9ENTR|nr:L-aspartate oxidase [Klebsiella indica]
MQALCLAVTTRDKKNVQTIAFRCYCSATMFSKLNKNHEYNA